MKPGWTEVALGEVCELRYGKALKAADRSGSGFPVYGSNGPVGRHEVALTAGPTIVVGRKGSLGEVHYSASRVWPIDTTYFVEERSTPCDLRWLAFRLDALGLTTLNRAAAVPGLNRDDAYRRRFLLPPIAEQRRTVQLLETAADLIARRGASLSLSRSLPASLFPSSGARECRLGDVLETIESGRSPVCRARAAQHHEWGVLKLGAVSTGTFRPAENKAVADPADVREDLAVRPGDVLLARKNTLDLVGASVHVHETPDRLMLPDLIFRLRLREDSGVHPRYLQAALSTAPVRHAIRRLAGGSAGSMPNVSKDRLRRVRLVVPTVEEQTTFATRLGALDRQRAALERHLVGLTSLLETLSARAFAGEL